MKVVGVDKEIIHSLIDKLTNTISDSIIPQIIPNIYYDEIEDNGEIKYVVICEVYCGSSTPYYIKTLGVAEGTFVRTAGSTRHVDDTLLKELELRGRMKSFDEQVYHMVPLDKKDIEIFCKKLTKVSLNNAKNDYEKETTKNLTISQLLAWGAIKEIDGKYYPTNAYMLLSNNNPFEFNRIQCGLFKGKSRRLIIDQKDFSGAIYEQIDEAYLFVLKHINLGFKFNGLYREEKYELPIRMIREIICNAVCHRQIMANSAIQIAIFDDRIEITSPGTLYGGLTVSMIRNGRTAIRNKVIANALKYLHYTEHWGLGIISSIEECIEMDLNEPEFIEMSEAFRVNIYRPSAIVKDRTLQDETLQDGTLQDRTLQDKTLQDRTLQDETLQDGTLQDETLQDKTLQDKDINNITEDMKKVLIFCQKEKSLSEIMEHISKTDRCNVKYKIIDKLISMNLLRMTLPNKPTSKNQKYICCNYK